MITGNHLQHSPKGTTWKDHKYIKKVNGRYVYPDVKISGSNKKMKAQPAIYQDSFPEDFSVGGRLRDEFHPKIEVSIAKRRIDAAKEEHDRLVKWNEEKMKKSQKIGEKALMSILGYDYLKDVKGPWKFKGEEKVHYGESGFYRNRKKGKVTNVQR